MTTSDTLLKAAINRLTVRLGKKLIDTATEISILAKEAPDKLKKEWDLLQDEILEEAERLNNESKEQKPDSDFTKSDDSQIPIEKIDQLRAKVATLNKKLESLK